MLPPTQIYQLLKMDCYMRFKRSDLVKECLLADMEGGVLPIGPAPLIPKNPWRKQKVPTSSHDCVWRLPLVSSPSTGTWF